MNITRNICIILATSAFIISACSEKKTQDNNTKKKITTQTKTEATKKTPTSSKTSTSVTPPKTSDKPAPKPLTPGDPVRGKKMFSVTCVPCHGATGAGDGAAAAALNPKPRNFTDPAWQKTVTDESLEKVILGGGPAIGKSPIMPPNPNLKNDPQALKDLVAFIRTLKK